MSEKKSGKNGMSSVEVFAQHALQNHIAPPSFGPVKARIRLAARKLGWSYHRVKATWYAEEGVSLRGRELVEIEEATGLRYGREEIKEIDKYLARADQLLDGPDADFYRPFVAAFRAFHRALDRAGTEE